METRPKVGDTAPDFEGQTFKDTRVRLRDYLGTGVLCYSAGDFNSIKDVARTIERNRVVRTLTDAPRLMSSTQQL